MVYRFFDKNSSGSGVAAEPNYQLANEVHRHIIRKIKKRKFIYLLETIFGVQIQLICNHWVNITEELNTFCAIDLLSKYAWVTPLKDNRGIRIVNVFEKIYSKGYKLNKICVNQGGQFYNNLFEIFLKINKTEIYLTCNERKSAAAKRFIKNLKNKLFKHMTAVPKNVYFDVLDDIINNNNTVHRTIKMKPIDVTSDSYAEYSENSKVGDRVRISKYKSIFSKRYIVNWSEETFVIKEEKIQLHGLIL